MVWADHLPDTLGQITPSWTELNNTLMFPIFSNGARNIRKGESIELHNRKIE